MWLNYSTSLNSLHTSTTTGWHGYTGAGNNESASQAYLNTLTSATDVAITLTSGAALQIGSLAGVYRAPTGDNGYFLSTSNASNNWGIKLDFTNASGGAIKTFALYWGSVDTWNTITFVNTQGTSLTFSGSQPYKNQPNRVQLQSSPKQRYLSPG